MRIESSHSFQLVTMMKSAEASFGGGGFGGLRELRFQADLSAIGIHFRAPGFIELLHLGEFCGLFGGEIVLLAEVGGEVSARKLLLRGRVELALGVEWRRGVRGSVCS